MPVRVIEGSSRRDIIDYLEKESREASDRPQRRLLRRAQRNNIFESL
jgi:hypothetical protein